VLELKEQFRLSNLSEYDGMSLRAIMKKTGHHYQTVKKYVDKEDWNVGYTPRKKRASKLEPLIPVMKKSFKIAIGVTLSLMVISLGLVLVSERNFRNKPIHAILHENREAYEIISHLLHGNFLECGSCLFHVYAASPSQDSNLIGNHTNENFFLEPGREISRALEYKENFAYWVIHDTFRMQRERYVLNAIRVFEKFVVFGTENGRESLIYSVEGCRPMFVNSPVGETYERISVRRITGNWYYATVLYG